MRVLLLLAFLLLIGSAQAQGLSQPASAPTASATRAAHYDFEVAALRQQNKLLEVQLASAKDFQGAVLDTIYWALGGVFLALSLVFGFSWFTNFKLYDRDKQALHADLQSRLDVGIKELGTEYSKTSQAVDRRVDEKFEEWKRSAEYQAELLTKQVQASSQVNVNALERSLAGLQREVLRISIRTESDPAVRVSLARRQLYHSLEAAPHEVPEAIAAILRSLDEGVRLTPQDVSAMNGLLEKVPQEHMAFATKLRERLVVAATR